MNIYNWYKLSRFIYIHHIPVIPSMIKALTRILWASVIPYQAEIGAGTVMGYQGLGIVIHKHIPENCVAVGVSAKIIKTHN